MHAVRFIAMAVLMSVLWAARSEAGITPSPYWKNQVVFPDDPFRGESASGEPRWVKFTILTSEPATVYYQDGRAFRFHYDFAAQVLDPFKGISPEQFDQISLYAQGQQAILGAVIFPSPAGFPVPAVPPEYGIQFVRRDAFPREEIRDLFHLVKATVVTSPGVQAFYFPTYEQQTVADLNRDWFAAQGIVVSSTARWATGNRCYAEGWAIGRLTYVPGDQIDLAYRSGELRPDDILLTDGVPIDVPIVAGLVTLTPTAPNSHIAILARDYGMPFAWLALEEEALHARQLVGRRIVYRARAIYDEADVRLADPGSSLDETLTSELLALKRPRPLPIQPIQPFGAYSAPADGLLPDDLVHFGGKAAHFGMLRTSIPDNSPVAVAVSFDLWNAFLDQTLSSGTTLRAQIQRRLARHRWPPADMAALADDLRAVRDLFRGDATTFSATLWQAVIAVLEDPRYEFDPVRNLRFRSSTNVEDSEEFSGAGLYESFSGCLADDLDGDDQGPSHGDPTEPNERGVFRAIKRVFASFYNENAYLERLRHGVHESDAGMALLVHHSFPDAFELANGVATVDHSQAVSLIRRFVTQLGAVPVTNPDPGTIPEEVYVYGFSADPEPYLVRSSNLVVLGETVLQWKDDYTSLAKLAAAAEERFKQVTGKRTYMLNLEYKKIAPEGRLVFKQLRELPLTDTAATTAPFLINDPTEYSILQGEVWNFGPGSVEAGLFGRHRLKSFWRLETASVRLTSAGAQQSFLGSTRLRYLAGNRVREIAGLPSRWPEAYHTGKQSDVPPGYPIYTTDGWRLFDAPCPRTYELEFSTIYGRAPLFAPIVFVSDFPRPELTVTYTQPVEAGSSWTMVDRVQLAPVRRPRFDDLLQMREFRDAKTGVSIRTSFYWPNEMGMAGYTAPLVRWVETTIEGLTRAPIVLRGEYSQTYGPTHHNFTEYFLFEPQLEEGIASEILAELRAKDVRYIQLYVDRYEPADGWFRTYGFGSAPSGVRGSWPLYR